MSKRKNLTKQQRQQVYNKYNGHCAYCGCELEYKDMQVDHLIPLNDWNNSHTDEELWSMDNLMPSCRLCNHYKRSYTLEHFREAIEKIPFKLNRDSYIYRVGVKYGIVNPNENRITFFFEKDTTGQKIKHYRHQAGFTQEQLGELSGINAICIARYETNKTEPTLPQLNKLAKALNIDTAQLVEIYSVNKDKNNSNKSIFLKENIENIVNEKVTVAELMIKQRKNIGLTGKQLSEITGINHGLIRQYETGRSIPKKYNCFKIASALNIDTQYFLLICAYDSYVIQKE